MDGTKEDEMDRENFEEYCFVHGWKVDHVSGDLMVSKYGVAFAERFEVGMNLKVLVDKMKKEDYETEGVQGEFPFTKTGELPM